MINGGNKNWSQQGGRILVADDEARNRRLLRDVLEHAGYSVVDAADGEEALRLLKEQNPDVVLLDVMMPKLDGYEVCRRIKAAPETASVPVLMVTVLSEHKDLLAGIEAGANDFLSKPIDTHEVDVRVRNAVHAKHLFDEVERNYHQISELEKQRDSLTHMIVHDLKNPLFSVKNFLDLIKLKYGKQLPPDHVKYIEGALGNVRDLVEMVMSMLDVSRMDAGKMPLNRSKGDLVQITGAALKMLGAVAMEKEVRFTPPAQPIGLECDVEIVRRIIVNLTSNALKFTPIGEAVELELEQKPGIVEFRVRDKGPGIPPEYHEKIFEKFGRVEEHQQAKMYSTGLGLTFCKMAVEAHGGTIGVKSEVGKGSTFWFRMPALESSGVTA